MDARRLATELALRPVGAAPVPSGHGGYPVTELVLALAPLVDRLDLVTLDPNLRSPVHLAAPGVRLAVGPFRPRARTRSLDLFAEERSFVAAQLGTWQPDAVSAHWTYEYALGSLDARRPTLTTVHDWAPTILWHARDAYRGVRLAMQGLVFARGSHFAAVSPYIAEKVERMTRRPVVVLPNGLGAHWFREPATQAGDPRVIAISDGFGRLKNVTRLLQAWPVVRREHPSAELELIGSGYETGGAAHEWAVEHGATSGVRFTGRVDRAQLPGRLRGARLLAHPALEESFGMVILEAMAVGIPVVGGRSSGAVPWVLGDGAGILVDVKDPFAIARGIGAILGDPDLAARTAIRGNRRARQCFNVASIAESYADRLESVAAAGIPQGRAAP
jgi:L-malate glycosyltransferase